MPGTAYLWFKGFHIVFMVTWFAGLFYLPRLFIYHVEAADEASRDRFTVMEGRLPDLLAQTWFQVKLGLVAGLVVYHVFCKRWLRLLAAGSTPQTTRGLRWFNEIPAAFLLAIVLLAVLKPA
jgi:putative membrane protein